MLFVSLLFVWCVLYLDGFFFVVSLIYGIDGKGFSVKTKTIPLKRYKKYKKLLKLVQEWTEAEVKARSPAYDFPEYAQYVVEQHDKENEIRELLYGTDNLISIGIKLGLPVEPKRKKKGRVKKNKNKKLRKP